MEVRPLTDADCGQPSALARLTSHVTFDHAFAESHGQPFPNSADQLVEQFLQETRAIPQSFRMDDLMREMQEIESQHTITPPVPATKIRDQLNAESWAQQYIDDGKNFIENTNHDAIWAEITSREQEACRLESDWNKEYLRAGPDVTATDVQRSANALLESVDDPKFQYSKFMKFMRQVGDGDIALRSDELTDSAQEWSEEYLQTAKASSKEFVQDNLRSEQNNDDYSSQFWDNLQSEWKKLAESEASNDHPWLTEFSEYIDPYKEYSFTKENSMKDVLNPLEKGKEFLAGGDLPSAVLCFEAAVQKDPDSVEAWLLLGVSQAENEQDPNAIAALKECLRLDPSNLKALMNLAISYTNESYYYQACQSLVQWLKNNPRYQNLLPADFQITGQVTSLIDAGQHKIVQDLFIKAAQQQPLDIDYEVQCGLGVLFNLSGEYEKAADCFRAAVSVKPDDARLWNRLGATLANGSKPEEAVEAYHHALNLSPGFIRARYNVGITCINLSAYREAAEHFLTALNLQAKGTDIFNSGRSSQMSESIWSTLRMCISLMNRQDLRNAVDEKNLKLLNDAFAVSDNS